jgi:iron complex outermembrane receptor protein
MPTLPRSFCLRPVAALILLYSTFAHGADTPATSDIFQLGEIEVNASVEPSTITRGFSEETVTEQSMQSNQTLDVGQALSHVTGISPTLTGQRSESQVYIRGFNQNQVTLNVDGIPIYVPYDGNVDLSRLLTPNLSEIVVTKGLGSLMYGPNNMGGTINLITKRPDKPLTMDVSEGISGGRNGINSTFGSAQLGSRINDQWYITGGVAYDNSTGFPLSSSFTPVAAQPAGTRLNAASDVGNYNLKIGFTPRATDEYAFGINTVHSTKQDAPYTGNTTVTGQKVAYWDWPQWDKQSYYFIGNTGIGEGYLKSRVYLDKFINQLDSYDNASYTTTARPYAFNSQYDDHSSGVNLELGEPVSNAHFVKVAGFYKDDVHTEVQLPSNKQPYESPWLNFEARTYSAGIEDTWKLSKSTELVMGYRHDRHEFDQAQGYTNNADTAIMAQPIASPADADNWQLTVKQDLGTSLGTGDPIIRAGIGQKTRFPGIKDIYSYSLGASIPNPSLGPEHALNREIGVAGRLGSASYDAALFWDSIDNAIQSVSVSPGLSQNQNVGTATNNGLDLSLKVPLAQNWLSTFNYSYLNRTLGTAGLVPTGTPNNRGAVSVTWLASDAVEFSADVQGNSSLQTTTNGLEPVAGSVVTNLRFTEHLSKELSINGGIYNLLDQNYELTQGFPMPGRTAKIALNYHL